MTQAYNAYCDESCHIEHDHQPVMVLGGVWCLQDKAREIAVRLREIKQQHGLPANFEIKWGKGSPAKADFYRAILDYFFDDDDLHFRAWVANKTNLRYTDYGQSHDDWYYKMMFGLLEPILSPDAPYRIYLDKRDTRRARTVDKLHQVICNSLYDFDRALVEPVQVIESPAVEQLQLMDLLLGAVVHVNRCLSPMQVRTRSTPASANAATIASSEKEPTNPILPSQSWSKVGRFGYPKRESEMDSLRSAPARSLCARPFEPEG